MHNIIILLSFMMHFSHFMNMWPSLASQTFSGARREGMSGDCSRNSVCNHRMLWLPIRLQNESILSLNLPQDSHCVCAHMYSSQSDGYDHVTQEWQGVATVCNLWSNYMFCRDRIPHTQLMKFLVHTGCQLKSPDVASLSSLQTSGSRDYNTIIILCDRMIIPT